MLEIAIFNSSSAVIAYTSAADRLELCADGSSTNGGTTPTLDTLRSVIDSLNQSTHHLQRRKNIPIYAMIRPRAGDFVYSEEEFRVMKEQLRQLKEADYSGSSGDYFKFGRVDGFVFGILTPDNKVDRTRNEELVRLAAPLPCTFHRAFDQVIQAGGGTSGEIISDDVRGQLKSIIDAGFAAILTSGGEKTALEGAEKIAALTEAADGRIAIIAGGGVRSTNARDLRHRAGTMVFHSSAVVDHSDVASSEEVRALKREVSSLTTRCS
ncbi:copper homeostasis protein CutC [Talaromyces proteolyticus]|uniref:Copper homeostasis protein cutC homolog n=1 Tax=Talaromyces proteolyticus TaxID=1131652 RepID=A0AAD4PWJ1_9EURO|nr:copper homeostasis protein CutC [Talaromyces proteolyticus]KAH8695140.1 copper homeostasis protein CutC [Talaromyces proteolyticus]